MIKKLTPTTLFGRAIVIVVAPIVLLQLILTIVFFDNHWDNVTRRLSLGIAGDIAVLIRIIKKANDTEKKEIFDLANSFMDMEIQFKENEMLPPSVIRQQPILNIPDRMLHKALGEKLFRPYAIDTANYGNRIKIQVQLHDGVLQILTNRKRIDSTSVIIFVLWMFGSSLILLGIAIIFLRNQLKPISKLAEIADSLGKGHDVKVKKLRGAREIKKATKAFLKMQSNLKKNIEQRTEMLAGVSHDLRTPLTRMKLELALLEKKIDVSTLESDIRDMEIMIEGYLSFARDQGSEKLQQIDIRKLLEEITLDIERRGQNIFLRVANLHLITLREHAFKRCLLNLVNNSMTYAHDSKLGKKPLIEINAYKKNNFAEISVDDNGPGIPEEKAADAFKAFNRLDSSRGHENVGVGLGLTIARDIAQNHGGDILLEKSHLGGLRAIIKIPI